MIPRVIGATMPIRHDFLFGRASRMAVKKSSSKPKTKTKKAGGSKGATKKKAAPKKSARSSAASKASKTKSSKAKSAGKSAAVKLSTSQSELLKRVGGSGVMGYKYDKKAEQRSLDALVEKKLIKRGAKDKADAKHPYLLTNVGKKHIGSSSTSSAPGSGF
jgi:hypothetical protein